MPAQDINPGSAPDHDMRFTYVSLYNLHFRDISKWKENNRGNRVWKSHLYCFLMKVKYSLNFSFQLKLYIIELYIYFLSICGKYNINIFWQKFHCIMARWYYLCCLFITLLKLKLSFVIFSTRKNRKTNVGCTGPISQGLYRPALMESWVGGGVITLKKKTHPPPVCVWPVQPAQLFAKLTAYKSPLVKRSPSPAITKSH